jgi:hypothetical protein
VPAHEQKASAAERRPVLYTFEARWMETGALLLANMPVSATINAPFVEKGDTEVRR